MACDVPAGHKTCGFLGHAAHYGCSKCFKKFSGSAGKIDYSGFDRENWYRYSSLVLLPYSKDVNY